MQKLSKTQKRILFIVLGLVILTGCAMPDKDNASHFYDLSTSFAQVWEISKFQAIFVLPITYVINFVIEKLNWGIIAGIGIATLLVNLVTLPLMLYSQTNSAKMQLLQPQVNKINKKYEGREDQQSNMQKAQETQQLYKDNNIKMSMTLLGSLIPFPLLIAMLQAVYRANSLFDDANRVMGSSLNVKPFDGFKTGPNGWLYIVIILVMIGTQFIAMKLPQYLAKKRLEKDRSYKKYDEVQSQPAAGAGMMNMMVFMMIFIAISTPTTMSIYYTFSSIMMILRSIIGDQMVAKSGISSQSSRGSAKK
ncbi:MAG: membrane protein insertase YidC [Erysipelothrix sp.]|nr:membrane protein insertase YidC [Erysipelothrix sp.]